MMDGERIPPLEEQCYVRLTQLVWNPSFVHKDDSRYSSDLLGLFVHLHSPALFDAAMLLNVSDTVSSDFSLTTLLESKLKRFPV
mmetsp:Transcript_1555/g.5344  ORF Transcript_1555/g.5344 Transcript_1555/m.5344 type:complete len:84 (+) Transcript_1555:302-553(+)|eukprot:CAMPEP_0117447216 /NCGR_PEP_ID=MMETSP0759-20121206/6756_1 /TAXON_ID=63605 /ORGANISM="Percolomonas cosmopolitus, Strain WS" /LENGTH=83 /DNA_ID=CAMNT_0005239535 /DNA_START=291 /DNA_END=542 /DNA_ORIENTATION=+